MAIAKLLSILDMLTGLLLLLFTFGLGGKIILLFAAYLIIKALVFLPDIASIADLIAGLYILLLLIGIGWSILTWVVVIWLLQKLIFVFI